jgi:hypothetical protein
MVFMDCINKEMGYILFDQIYEQVQNTFFSDISFDFENSKFDLNFINSIQLGSAFSKACEILELDINKVKECIFKYILHQLREESLTLSSDELAVLRDYYDETINGTKLEDIFWDEYFETPSDYMDYYEQALLSMGYAASIEEYQDKKNKIFEKLFNNITYTEYFVNELGTNKEWCTVSKKSGNFLRIYKDYKKRKREPFNKKPGSDRMKYIDKDFRAFVNNTSEYLRLLEILEESQEWYIDHSEDLLKYERKTGLFFILKCYMLLKNKGIEGETVPEDYLKILSTFSIIDDLNLKLYLAKLFVKEGIFWLSKKDKYAFAKLFEIIIIYTPFLKEFIKRKIYSMAPPNLFQVSDTKNPTLDSVKRKLYLYTILRKNKCYELNEIKQELNIDSLMNLNEIDTILFEKLYKKVFKLRKKKEEFFNDVYNAIIEQCTGNSDGIARNIGKFIENVLIAASSIFMCDGDLLALEKSEDFEVKSILNEYKAPSQEVIEKKLEQIRELLSGE